MNAHFQHWDAFDLCDRNRARTFSDLAKVAVGMLSRLPPEARLHMVSGPISTGGRGSLQENRRVLGAIIEGLHRQGLPVYSQMPYEDKLVEFAAIWRRRPGNSGYCWPILHEFYEHVFSSGRISTLHFIPGYETSTGAKWEHDECDRWGIQRVYLSQGYCDQALLAAQRAPTFARTA